MNTPETYIYVKFQQEGIHRYPAAATDPKLATGDWDDVSFLAHPHRHIFHFKVYIEVFHDDRDLEFIQEKRFMQRLFDTGAMNIDYKSCEMLADDLYAHLKARYFPDGIANRDIVIDVSEDDENGAVKKYEKDQRCLHLQNDDV